MKIKRTAAGVALAAFLLAVPASQAAAKEKNGKDMTPEKIQGAYYSSYDYEEKELYEKAVESLMPVYKIYPDAYTVNLRLGWLYHLNKSYANAVSHYRAADKAAPQAIDAKLGLLLPLLAQEKYEEVETTAYQVLKKDENNYYANLRLTYALRQQKKYDLAEKINDAMLALHPTDVPFLTEKAIVKALRKDAAAASALYWDILILDPQNAEANAWFSGK